MRYEDLRSGVVPYLLGALAIVVLFLVLHQVLRDAVRNGVLLQITNAERVETNWRCNAAHGPRLREDCISQRTNAATKDAGQTLATAELRKP